MSCLIAYTYVSVIVIRFIVCELLLTEGDRPSNQKRKSSFYQLKQNIRFVTEIV